MRIGIVGAGGAGGYFAGRWSEAGLDVTLLARGDHLEALQQDGLRIISPMGDVLAHPTMVRDGSSLAGLDVVMYATKTWQLPTAIAQTREFVSPDAFVFGIQNGIDSADVLARGFPVDRTLGATCRIISFVESPGVIRHVGADPTIDLGNWARSPSPDLDRLADELTVAGKATVNHSPDIRFELWKKFLFFAPLSGIGAMHDLPIGIVRSEPEIRSQLEQAMNEVARVANAIGVDLGPNDVTNALAFVDAQPAEGTSSLQRDVAAGRHTEFDSLSVRVAALGKAYDVPTPTHDTIVEQVKRKLGRHNTPEADH